MTRDEAEKVVAEKLIVSNVANMTNWRAYRLLDYLLERKEEEPLGRPTEVEKSLWNLAVTQQQRIGELEAQNEWIPVIERLPEPGTPVIIWLDADGYSGQEADHDQLGSDGKWILHVDKYVMAWMPYSALTAPPEAKK